MPATRSNYNNFPGGGCKSRQCLLERNTNQAHNKQEKYQNLKKKKKNSNKRLSQQG